MVAYESGQTLDSLRGEIALRRDLARQQTTGEVVIPDYADDESHDEELRRRIHDTFEDIDRLEAAGVTTRVFLELGAERVQRAAALTSERGMVGLAADLSLDQLQAAPVFAERFGHAALPLRLCCDANALPIRDDTIPFGLSYQFLHHFPSNAPVLVEAHRVLAPGGRYFIGEEPLKRPKLVLFRRNLHRNWPRPVRFVLHYISEPFEIEGQYGIVENEDISAEEWRSALAVFDHADLELLSAGGRIRSHVTDRIGPRTVPNRVLGGIVRATCRKAGSTPAVQLPQDRDGLLACLRCPDCTGGLDRKVDRFDPDVTVADAFTCTACGATFPVELGVIVLLPTTLRDHLYPHLSTAAG